MDSPTYPPPNPARRPLAGRHSPTVVRTYGVSLSFGIEAGAAAVISTAENLRSGPPAQAKEEGHTTQWWRLEYQQDVLQTQVNLLKRDMLARRDGSGRCADGITDHKPHPCGHEQSPVRRFGDRQPICDKCKWCVREWDFDAAMQTGCGESCGQSSVRPCAVCSMRQSARACCRKKAFRTQQPPDRSSLTKLCHR